MERSFPWAMGPLWLDAGKGTKKSLSPQRFVAGTGMINSITPAVPPGLTFYWNALSARTTIRPPLITERTLRLAYLGQPRSVRPRKPIRPCPPHRVSILRSSLCLRSQSLLTLSHWFGRILSHHSNEIKGEPAKKWALIFWQKAQSLILRSRCGWPRGQSPPSPRRRPRRYCASSARRCRTSPPGPPESGPCTGNSVRR